MREPRSLDDVWFAEMLKPLASDGHRSHPPHASLHAYLNGHLSDRWLNTQEWQTASEHWTLTTVSQHLLVCQSCQSEVSQMRRAQWPNRWEEIVGQFSKPNAVALHVRSFALGAALLLLLNWAFIELLPAPIESLVPCGSAEQPLWIKGTGASSDYVYYRSSHGSLRLCLNIPERALWQTWWSPLVLVLWLSLLLVHGLWFLLSRWELRQRREWVGSSGLTLMRSISPVLFR